MSHLLETSNPGAAQEIKDANPAPPQPVQAVPALDHPAPERVIGLMPLPQVSDMVLYHPRGGEVRRGRKVVPALVIWRDEEARELDLCLIHEANDVRQIERAREWPGGEERGWEAKGDAVPGFVGGDVDVLRAEIAELRSIVLGEYLAPEEGSILAMLDALDQRVDAMAGVKTVKNTVKNTAAKPVKKAATKKKSTKGK